MKILAGAPVLWIILAAPGALLVQRYAASAVSYGEFIHWSGDISVWLLIVSLAVSPLRRVIRGEFSAWLGKRRRDLGVAVFGYAAGHLGAYLLRKADAALIWKEGVEPGLLTGWIALAIFLALALTSNNISVRWLKSGWKRLHWFVYAGAILTAAHWLLTAFDPMAAIVHAVIIAILLALRFVPARQKT
ncbi:MAG: ferric reductase-like transmembrane domain-containing protein [Hyphomonadaceae bacterium]|nr:ferric reductase-like transmembrane domain-containing protein [Hyphomonadaceae bacterium]